MTIDDKASAIHTFEDMLNFSEKYSKSEIKAIKVGIELLNFFVCEDAISRRAMIMTTCANCSERICPFRDGGTDPSTACEYVQRIKALKPVIPILTAKEPKDYRDGQGSRRFVLAENIQAILMLEVDQKGGCYADDKIFLTPFTDIVLRLVMDRPGGEKERLDVVMSNEQAMAIRKALKQQVKRNGGWEKKKREGDD